MDLKSFIEDLQRKLEIYEKQGVKNPKIILARRKREYALNLSWDFIGTIFVTRGEEIK